MDYAVSPLNVELIGTPKGRCRNTQVPVGGV